MIHETFNSEPSEVNQGALDLQSNALPLSYTPKLLTDVNELGLAPFHCKKIKIFSQFPFFLLHTAKAFFPITFFHSVSVKLR